MVLFLPIRKDHILPIRRDPVFANPEKSSIRGSCFCKVGEVPIRRRPVFAKSEGYNILVLLFILPVSILLNRFSVKNIVNRPVLRSKQ